jgi:PAS domain S-box-containing protein
MRVTTPGTGRLRDLGATTQRRERRRLANTVERARAILDSAGLASWEWHPESDEIVIFDALAVEETRATASLEGMLRALPVAERVRVREGLATFARGESDELLRRHCYVFPGGHSAWLEVRARAVRGEDGSLLCVRGITHEVSDQQRATQELIRGRDFFQGTLDSLPAQIAVLDEHGEIIMTNRAWNASASASGAAAAAGIGANYLRACDTAGEDELASTAGAGLRAIIDGRRREFAMEYPCSDPKATRWFLVRAARYDGPGPACVVVAHDDITTRRQAQDEVATQAALLDEVDVSVIATDPDGLVTHWNRGAERLYGWTREEALGRRSAELIVPAGPEPAEEIMSTLRRQGHWEGAFTACRKDGSTFSTEVRDRLILDSSGSVTGTIAVSVDMTERVASERELLAARNYMRAVADSMGEGLFTLDPAGRLIYMNEAAESLLGWTLGELKGRVMHDLTHGRRRDGTPFPIAECPIAQARCDGVTVRVEDDLFLTRDGQAVPVAYTAAPFVTDDGIAGCAVVVQDITDRKAQHEDLERHVDTLRWIGRVQEALAQDRFVLYAQPIIDVRSGEVVQRELLLRMHEPDGSVITPGEFLPAAEEYGLIGEVDRWVIARASEIAAVSGGVELNLSARSMSDRTVLDYIEECLQRTGADPRDLVFEITETALVADESAAVAFAKRLHGLGCKLALDDFGTGYGGFTYLKRFPVDYLKIDVEFVRDLSVNPASRHVVEAVAALAHAFALKTVAEGVEDAQTLALLRELGVEFAQGYHIAMPALERCHHPSPPPGRGGAGACER